MVRTKAFPPGGPIASGFIASVIAIGFAQQESSIRRCDFIGMLGWAGTWMAAAVSFAAAQIITFQPLSLKQFLKDNGWVSLPLPDRRMGPGSIIKVTKKDGAVISQWLGGLRRCGITDQEFRYVRDKYPAIGIGESFGIRASSAAAFITKLEGTADFEKAGGAIMQIEASGGDAVDFDALTSWMVKSAAGQRMCIFDHKLAAGHAFENGAHLIQDVAWRGAAEALQFGGLCGNVS
jgi:hypothetical protein